MKCTIRSLLLLLLLIFLTPDLAHTQTCSGTYTVSASQPRCVNSSISFIITDTSSRSYIYTWKWWDGSSPNTSTSKWQGMVAVVPIQSC
ncbi:MAG: hypothetical protein WD077_03215 [Bacteroidia bacterium]